MITKKLLEFQKLGISVKKTGLNPHFKSSYATLNEVLEKVKKPLNDLGVVIVQIPERDGLRTRLIDTTGKTPKEGEDLVATEEDFVECFVPYVNATDMQKLGGAITYARRYSLVTLLGLEDEDDDGNKASEPTVQYAPKPAFKPTVKAKTPTPEEAHKAAHDAIMTAMTPEGMTKVAEKITASTILTEEQKADLMDTLQARSELI